MFTHTDYFLLQSSMREKNTHLPSSLLQKCILHSDLHLRYWQQRFQPQCNTASGLHTQAIISNMYVIKKTSFAKELDSAGGKRVVNVLIDHSEIFTRSRKIMMNHINCSCSHLSPTFTSKLSLTVSSTFRNSVCGR